MELGRELRSLLVILQGIFLDVTAITNLHGRYRNRVQLELRSVDVSQLEINVGQAVPSNGSVNSISIVAGSVVGVTSVSICSTV